MIKPHSVPIDDALDVFRETCDEMKSINEKLMKEFGPPVVQDKRNANLALLSLEANNFIKIHWIPGGLSLKLFWANWGWR
jgi:hypothetical protein